MQGHITKFKRGVQELVIEEILGHIIKFKRGVQELGIKDIQR